MNTIAELGQLRNVPVDMTLSSLAALNRGQHKEELGLQDMMRQQQFNYQADPMKLQQMSIENDTGLQTLHQMKRNNREADELSPYRMQAELVGYLAKAKQGDIDLAVSRLQEMAMSQDPNIAQQGRFLLQGTKDFLMQRMKDEADMARTKQQGADQRSLRQMEIDAGRFKPNGAASLSIEQRISVAKTPVEKAEILESAYHQAVAAGDIGVAQQYAIRAKEARERAIEDANARRPAPGIDPAAATGLPRSAPARAEAPIATGALRLQPTPTVASRPERQQAPTVVRTGTEKSTGRKIEQLSDGTIRYAN